MALKKSMDLENWLKKNLPKSETRLGATEAVFTTQVSKFLRQKAFWILVLTLLRLAIHFFRFDFVAKAFPIIDLHEMASWILKIGILEAFVYGLNEDLRQHARSGSGTATHRFLNEIRKKRALHLLIICGFYLSFCISTLEPILFSDRIFSVYDAIQMIVLFQLGAHLYWMPDLAVTQGRSRLHFQRRDLFLPEILSAVFLPIFAFTLGPWGIIYHYAFDMVLREWIRYRVLKRTRVQLGVHYSLTRLTFNGPLPFRDLLKTIPLGLIQILFRLESFLILFALRADIDFGFTLFLFLPLLKLPTGFIRNFMIERLKSFQPLDLIAGRKLRRPIFYFGIILCVVAGSVSLLVTQNVKLTFWVFSAAFAFLILSTFLHEFYIGLTKKFWGKKHSQSAGFWIAKSNELPLTDQQLRDLEKTETYRLRRGEIWISTQHQPSALERLQWIRFFKGRLKSLHFMPKNQALAGFMTAKEMTTIFRALVPTGAIRNVLPNTEPQESLKQANRFLKNGFSDKKLQPIRARVESAWFPGDEVLFFIDPSGEDGTKWREILSRHVQATLMLSQNYTSKKIKIKASGLKSKPNRR